MRKRNRVVTIEDLAQMTKKGFDEVYERMDKRFDIVERKFIQNEREHREVKEEIHEKFDKIMVGQDKIIGMLEDRKTEDAADLAAHYRFEEKLKDHEKRIETLETK